MSNEVYVAGLKYANSFDHSALVSGIARAYSQRGIAVRPEPTLPGGKHADLAISLGERWTYVEVKTRAHFLPGKKRLSFRQDFLREIMRLRAHSLKQLPKKEASLVVLATSASPNRRRAMSKIALARSFTNRIFDHDCEKVLGLMIFAPFRSYDGSKTGWRYASTMIQNPNRVTKQNRLDELSKVQL